MGVGVGESVGGVGGERSCVESVLAADEVCVSGEVARSSRQISIGPAPPAPMGTRGTCAGGEAAKLFTCGAEPVDRTANGGSTAVDASAHGGCMPSGSCAPPPAAGRSVDSCRCRRFDEAEAWSFTRLRRKVIPHFPLSEQMAHYRPMSEGEGEGEGERRRAAFRPTSKQCLVRPG